MFRKTIIAVAATAAIGAASLTPASAHHFGFGWGGIGLGIGLLGASIAASNYATYPAYDSCWQYQLVPTRHGYLHRALVNVCQ
jgi:hypothetical protein